MATNNKSKTYKNYSNTNEQISEQEDMIYINYGDETYYCTKQEIELSFTVILLVLSLLIILYTFFLSKHFKKKYSENTNTTEQKKTNKSDDLIIKKIKSFNMIKYLPYILYVGVLILVFYIILSQANFIVIDPIEFILSLIITACAYSILPLFIKYVLKKNFNFKINILLAILNMLIVHGLFYFFAGSTTMSVWGILGSGILFHKDKNNK